MRQQVRLFDVTVAALVAFVQVAGSYGASRGQSDRADIDVLAVALLLIGPIALIFRDRAPVLVAAITAVAAVAFVGFGFPYGPAFLSVVVGFFSAVQTGKRSRVLTVAGLAYVGVVIAASVSDDEDDPRWLHLALVAAWFLVVLVVSELVKLRNERIAERRRTQAQEQRAQLDAQRLRLAQDLHDVLAHNISLINVQASVGLHLFNQRPDQALGALTHIKEASHEALNELRAALDILRNGDAPLRPSPMLSDLDTLVEKASVGGLTVTLDVAIDLVPSETTQLAVYRIVQEALTNVARHARATRASVVVTDDGKVLRVEIGDNGPGNPVIEGNGITGMRERAAASGGSLEIAQSAGGGLRVLAQFPRDAGT